MSIRGKWRVVETPGYDMAVAGAFILFDEDSGEFALDCLTGCIHAYVAVFQAWANGTIKGTAEQVFDATKSILEE